MKAFRTYLSNGEYLGRQLFDRQHLVEHGVNIKGDVARWPAPDLPKRRVVAIHYISGEGYRLDCMVNGAVTCVEHAGDWKTAWFLKQRWEMA